jgi:hypothetical protein
MLRDTLTSRLMISILAAMVAGAVLDILLSLAVGRWSRAALGSLRPSGGRRRNHRYS